MQSLEYVCAATGERIGFEGPLYGETLTGLRARVWDYSLASRGMTGITRKAREATVTVKIHDSPATLDLLRRLADADMASGEPGTLIADGEWKAGAWITKSEPQSITPTMVETQLTIVLADGVWRRSTMTHFTPRYDSGTSDLDYPHDYPHDFAGMALGAEIVNDTSIPQPVKLTIFGPCTQPVRHHRKQPVRGRRDRAIRLTSGNRRHRRCQDRHHGQWHRSRHKLLRAGRARVGQGFRPVRVPTARARNTVGQLAGRIPIRLDGLRGKERTAMDLIVTDATGKPVASHASYTLDLAFGSGENDFDLQVEDAALKAGSRIMIDGTEYGGIIDDTDVDVDGGLSTVTWHGRDWHGVLASKIIEPDRNNDYLTLSGTIPVIMRTLVSRAGLQGLFTVTDESADHKTTCQFDRYVDLYSGLVKMLRASGLKLRLRNDGDKVAMSAMPVRTIGDSIDSDLIDFTAKQAAHPINHLICLGKGELKDRTVIHWYADANGTFSHTQTLKGLDERTATYELSNAEADELEDKGRQKFQELRNTSTIDVDIPDGIDADVGDLVTGRDNNTGLVVTAEISKKIVKVSGGVLTVTYESGGASAGGNSGESSIGDGGHAYYAGAGLKLDAWTFSADVTRNDIDSLNNALSGKQPKGDYITGLKIGSVDTLAPGAQASASLTGAGSDKTLNLGLPKGDQGPQGEKGDKGDAGPQGAAGATGPTGPRGEKGATGERGPQGVAGPEGPQGLQGIRGEKGDKGDAGAIGAAGPQGPTGSTGPQGPTGPQGATGPQGRQGIQGSQGIQGPQGEKGDKGDSGVSAPSNGFFTLSMEGDGDLYVNYPDNTNPPSFVWDSESGNLYVDIPER